MPNTASSAAQKWAPITDAAFNVRLAGAGQPVEARLDGRLHRVDVSCAGPSRAGANRFRQEAAVVLTDFFAHKLVE